jgi:RNA polymerase sigma-70 factor (sigma-E family)
MEGVGTGSSPDDELLSRLFQQVAETQEPQFAAAYDLQAGLDRYRGWLREHSEDAAGAPVAVSAATADAVTPDAVTPDAVTPDAVTPDAVTPDAVTPDAVTPDVVTPDVVTPDAVTPGAFLAAAAQRVEWSADLAVIELYTLQYKALVRLAAMLVRDISTAEEVVQDAFIAMHDGWHRLKDAEKALAYLRQAVVNRSRSVLRHRMVVEKNAPKPAPDMPSAEHGAMALLERSAVIAALRDLPERQREAVVLRYYADLSEAQIAAAMRISRGAVKSHTSRAMAALRAALEQDAW